MKGKLQGRRSFTFQNLVIWWPAWTPNRHERSCFFTSTCSTLHTLRSGLFTSSAHVKSRLWGLSLYFLHCSVHRQACTLRSWDTRSVAEMAVKRPHPPAIHSTPLQTHTGKDCRDKTSKIKPFTRLSEAAHLRVLFYPDNLIRWKTRANFDKTVVAAFNLKPSSQSFTENNFHRPEKCPWSGLCLDLTTHHPCNQVVFE